MSTPRLDIFGTISKHSGLLGAGNDLVETKYAYALGYNSFHDSVSRISAEGNLYGIIEIRSGKRSLTDLYRQYFSDPGSVDIREFVLHHSKFQGWWDEVLASSRIALASEKVVPNEYLEAFQVASFLCGFLTPDGWDFERIKEFQERDYTLIRKKSEALIGSAPAAPAESEPKKLELPAQTTVPFEPRNNLTVTLSASSAGLGLRLTLLDSQTTEPSSSILSSVLNSPNLTIEKVHGWELTCSQVLKFSERQAAHDWVIDTSRELIRLRDSRLTQESA